MGMPMISLRRYLPRGNTLDDAAWLRRHRIVLIVLVLHLPVLFAFGLVLGNSPLLVAEAMSVPLLCVFLGYVTKVRRLASVIVTAGLTWCSVSLVGFTHGSIEAHFHFFIIIGFIALYQDWIPFLWNVFFTVVSHGVGSALYPHLIFNHHAAQANPWAWSAVHGIAVAAACTGVVLFWRVSEDDQYRVHQAARQTDLEAGRRRFTSDLLINLARRNQKMLYRQLDIINQLEEKERDPDALGELFQLEHLATRVRRNAESLLVLSGEGASRVWPVPVPLREVVQAAIAETEDLERVTFNVAEHLAVAGNCVADLTHLLAELAENAVRFSPPGSTVSVAQRPYPHVAGAQLLTIEDWGVGMRPEALIEANKLLTEAPEVDLSASRQLGFHVVARLAKRHGITVSLTPTPGCGVTAAVVLPAELFGPAVEPDAGRHVRRGGGLLPAPVLGRLRGRSRESSALVTVDGQRRWERTEAPVRARPETTRAEPAPVGARRVEYVHAEPARTHADADRGHPAPSRDDGYATAEFPRDGYTPAEPSRDGYAKAEPSRDGYTPAEPSRDGYAPAESSRGGYAYAEPGRAAHAEAGQRHPRAGYAPTEAQPVHAPVEARRGPAPAEPPRRAPAEQSRAESPRAERSQRELTVAEHAAAMAARAAPLPPPALDPEDEQPADDRPRLTRRRPQTHIAPELRHPVPYPRTEQPEAPAPPTSSDALSRYQASRHAARVAAEQENGKWERPT
ncbi:hypothetical protein GCM10023321_15860 [Pseudonocardia eucalypti]|uniref:histidine kinase n=1 Tax=Pseudonocardia eucalypti TaxID=648755 RepID=A0ABP9PQG8_9PSEU|nr:signal transduction histidine kinase [Pseudonocardia eucalypti]